MEEVIKIYKLKVGQMVWLRKVLKERSWLWDVGYGDGEYIRLNDILDRDEYFDFDKRMLNEIRESWIKYNPTTI